MSVSIIIPVYDDSYYLVKVLNDITKQSYPHNKIEVIIIEAGKNKENDVKAIFLNTKISLKYFHVQGLNRNASLNLGIRNSMNSYIIRLDARTHIKHDYIEELIKLSKRTQCTNVGGVKVPIGASKEQILIARVMQDPLCLGGANFRKKDFEGNADTVYLGCYKKDEFIGKIKFDEKLIRISEDADFNFNLKCIGKKTYVSSKIKAYYYSRETIKKFIKLMFNYGVSRGLFVIKNKTITSLRQVILPTSSLICIVMFFLGFKNLFFFYLLLLFILFYFLLIITTSLIKNRKSIQNMTRYAACLFGTHIAWTLGFFYSFILYFKYSL